MSRLLTLEQILGLLVSLAFVLTLNLKAGQHDWSGILLKWVSYVLILAGLALLVYKMWELLR